jgi:hypothetical protein
VVDLLTYDEDQAFSLMDDAATANRIVRTTPVERLRAVRIGEWTAVQSLAHLVDTAEVFAERIRRAIEEDTPTVQVIPAGRGADPDADPMDLAKRLLAAHQRIVAYLQTPGARERPLIHSDWGRVTAGHVAAYQADHSGEHLRELAAAFPPAR